MCDGDRVCKWPCSPSANWRLPAPLAPLYTERHTIMPMTCDAEDAMDVQQVTLAGHVARVEPLGFQHADDLLRAGADPTIWTYMPTDPSGSADAMRTWIADALALRETGSQLPFAIIEVLSGQAVGST